MRQTFLPFSRPSIGKEEIAEVVDTLCSDWITTGPKVKRFEQEFAEAVDAPAALALSSCTAALHLALVSQGIGPGDAVITTPMTFCATVHAIELAGARPLLVDVEPGTLNLDVALVGDVLQELAGSERGKGLKAILPVHLYGHPCEMAPLLEIARRHQLAVVEDAAHALPASYHGRPIGSQLACASVPLLTCFSFCATESTTTGEGGMVTGLPEMVEEARRWSSQGISEVAASPHGAERSWHYEVFRPGFKYNMTDLQAAIGIHQLTKQTRLQARRAEIARQYNAAFSEFDFFQIPANFAHVDHAWDLYVLRLCLDRLEISRNQFIEELAARNIAGSVHFIPIHLHPYYRGKYGYKPEDFPVAYREYQRIISLPIYPGMSNQDVDDVIGAVAAIARKYMRNRKTVIVNLAAARSGRRVPAQPAPSAAGEIGAAARRAFDVACAASGLLLLAPLFALIAAAIKWEDGGPVFYMQMRVGKGFRPFRLFKFRSMIAHSFASTPIAGPGDPRITRVGRFLRMHKLDELPQLINVLAGDMQLVGVRPQLERYVQVFPDEYRDLLQDRPGITDLASLQFRNEEQMFGPGSLDEQYLTQILPEKLQLALKYRRIRTFLSDLEIIFRTVLGFKSPSIN
jgi:dTDP-4-amino-4,6-dideoxygalactose transaminase/lipopolysaccharide/colanic/teichoic acid biosynthesis glycosyltransferase